MPIQLEDGPVFIATSVSLPASVRNAVIEHLQSADIAHLSPAEDTPMWQPLIEACGCFVLVNNDGASRDNSLNDAIKIALTFKKPILVATTDDAPVPAVLASRRCIDLDVDDDANVEAFIAVLLASDGVDRKIETLEEYLQDSLTAKAGIGKGGKVLDPTIATLRRKIAAFRNQEVETPTPDVQPGGQADAPSRNYFATKLPRVGSLPFSGRQAELYGVEDFINQDDHRVLAVIGDSGMGKTALVVQALKERSGKASSASEHVVSEALSKNNPLSFATLFDDIARLRPELLGSRYLSGERKVQALLDLYAGATADSLVLFLDDLDSVMSKGHLTSPTLGMFLRSLLTTESSSIKVIFTSHVWPKDLAGQPRCEKLRIKEGLTLTETRRFIEALNQRNPGSAGIEAHAEWFHKITGGNPQALFALHGMWRSDPLVMEKIEAPKKRGLVLEILLPQAIPRLESDDEWVLQVLSVAGRALTSEGVNQILRGLKPNLQVSEALDSLVDLGLVLEDEGEFHVHKSTEVCVVAKLDAERGLFPIAPSRLRKLRHHAADYFRATASPSVVSERDVSARQTEFNLRMQLEDYDRADEILGEIEPFVERRSHHGLMRILSLSVQQAATDGTQAKRSATRRLAWAHWRMWQPRKAFDVQRTLIGGDKPAAEDLFRLAKYGRSLGDYSAAKSRLIEAMSRARAENSDQLILSRIEAELGICHERTGFLGTALRHYDAALREAKNILPKGDDDPAARQAIAEYLRLRAACFISIGWADRAAIDIAEAAELAGPENGGVRSLNQMVLEASLAASRGNFERARDLMRDVIGQRRQLPNSSGLEADLTRLGRWNLIDGMEEDALALAEEARGLMQERNGTDLSADILVAQSLASLGRWEETRQLVASLLSKRSEDGRMKRQCLVGIASLATSRTDKAVDAFEAARKECVKWLRFPNDGGRTDHTISNPEVLRLLVVAQLGLEACGRPVDDDQNALSRLEATSETDGSRRWTAWWQSLLHNAVRATEESSTAWKPRSAARSLTDDELSKIQEIVDKPAPNEPWRRIMAVAKSGLGNNQIQNLGMMGPLSKVAIRTALSTLAKGGKSDTARALLRNVVLPRLSTLQSEDQTLIANILVSYDLVDKLTKAELIERYDVLGTLKAVSGSEGIRVGAHFELGADEVTTYQLFEQTFPPLDVASLWEGLLRSTAVCRIDIAGKPMGTGFLVAPNRILTNFHVLGESLQAAKEAVSVLTASFTSINPARPMTQRSFLPAEQPILASSPADALDYVLIEMKDDINTLIDARPIELAEQSVRVNDPLHILQHPGGASLKLAISDNGVRRIDAGAGLIRYSTHARGGASGAPCFDEQWRLVALHHAEVSTTFGAVREGIIIGSILKDIETKLGR